MAKVVVPTFTLSLVEEYLIFNKRTTYTGILRVIDRVGDPCVATLYPHTEYVCREDYFELWLALSLLAS